MCDVTWIQLHHFWSQINLTEENQQCLNQNFSNGFKTIITNYYSREPQIPHKEEKQQQLPAREPKMGKQRQKENFQAVAGGEQLHTFLSFKRVG